MITLLAQDVLAFENFGHAAFTDETNVHPVGLAMLVVASVAVLALPRRHALIPLLLMMTIVPSAQRIAILSLDFTFVRLLIVAAVVRIAARGEAAGFVWKPLDRVMLLWASAYFAVTLLRVGGSAFVYQCGFTMDALGGYFVARCLLRDWADLNRLIRAASFVAIPVAVAFLIELSTQRNLFSFFGGVPAITMIRQDRLRCQGPYNHPILAGCFWAALLPLMAARGWQPGAAKREALLASGAALTIVYCCASSTPVFGVVGALVGALFFGLRHRLRAVRWALVFSIIGLHLIMHAPVWHLISRVSAVGGSTSYFRYQLIDSFVKRVSEWGLVGVNSTAHWFWGAQDLTNHYVVQGVRGGVVTLSLFIVLISLAFGGIGRACRRAENDRQTLILVWALGVSLLVHCFNFFGVSYFGTITGLWYLTLGVIGSLSPVKNTQPMSCRPASIVNPSEQKCASIASTARSAPRRKIVRSLRN